MKPVYYLAVDIGASSGRHILASMDNGRMTIEEVYRFDNGMINDNGNKLWDVDSLFANIIEGMKKCKELGKIPVSMSIDTWAVDYVLLDDNDKCIGNVYGYRDERTDGMDEEVYKVISEKELYKRTGIQKQKFNTIYQLMSDKFIRPEQLKEAKTFIMLPDYFQFLLTGVKASEYTNATSTQLVNPETKQWDYELIDMLGINRNMFMELKQPGTILGELTDVLRNAFVPIAQYLPQSILSTIGGSLLVERFFSVPGMGPLLTDSINRYDTNVVQTLVILYATLGIVGVFLGDVLMMIIDPRITLVGKGGTR